MSFALLAASALALHAHEHADSVRLAFRVNRVEFDPSFAGNADSLRAFERRITPLLSDSSLTVRSIRITGGASPEGNVKLNERLSQGRAERLYKLFRNSHPHVTTRSNFEFSFLGRDWAQLLARVKADPSVPYRIEVLALLERIVASLDAGTPDSEDNLVRLRLLRGGVPYAYLLRRHFPALRASKMVVEMSSRAIEPVELPLPEGWRFMPDTSLPPAAVVLPQAPSRRGFAMGVRTNLLYDLAAIPNLGVEFCFPGHLTLGANWMYGWWNADRFNFYWRLYGGEVNLRYWFGSAARLRPLTGHHLGLSAAIFTYDFELGGDGIMGGIPGGTLWDRYNTAFSAEYGYSLPISSRFNLDFTLGVGYVEGEYRRYTPMDGHYVWQSTHRLRYIGPTKAEVALVWRIGAQKGGGIW